MCVCGPTKSYASVLYNTIKVDNKFFPHPLKGNVV
jgi:hypothetical protein